MTYFIRLYLFLSVLSVLASCGSEGSLATGLHDIYANIGDTEIVEGDTGVSKLVFTVRLDEPLTDNATIAYETSDGSATAGVDYSVSAGTLTIISGQTSNTIIVLVNGDTDFEFSETVVVTLSNPSANVELHTDRAAEGTIVSDDIEFTPLNDTGVTAGANYPSDNNIDCSGETIAHQDCSFGRDVTFNDNSDGAAGFSYTKIDANGEDLSALASNWSCVRDNVTGLIWEVKTAVDTGLHQSNDKFFWSKTAASGDRFRLDVCLGYDEAAGVDSYCTTQAFRTRVNTATLCGASDWRLPTQMELIQLVNLNGDTPAVDLQYFPNTEQGSSLSTYWASNYYERYPGDQGDASTGIFPTAAYVRFYTGRFGTEEVFRSNLNSSVLDWSRNAVRLVRNSGVVVPDGPPDGPTDGPL